MEALKEKNQLEAGLTTCLAKLNIENGIPTNAEEVADSIVETIVAYFKANGGNIENSWAYLEDAFSPIQQLFLDEISYMNFLNQVTAKLSEKEISFAEVDDVADTDVNRKMESALGTCISCLSGIIHDIESAPLRSLEKVASAIDPKLPIDRRYELAQQLKLGMAWIASKGKLFISRPYSDDAPLLPEMVGGITPNTHINFHHANGAVAISASPGIIIDSIIAIEQEKKLMDAIGYADKVEINRNRLVFGAKGANLLAVQKLLPKLEATKFGYIARNVSIPPFTLVDIDVYKKWKNKEDISENLRAIYEVYKGKPMMVRSSAVYSEDGDQMTGAGIYSSVPLKDIATFEQFKKTVEKVYKSVDSEKAKKYRKENGVEEEFMGLVVQERIENPDLGYVNSTRPYTDDTTDLKLENRKAPYIFDSPQFDHLTYLDKQGFDVFRFASRVQQEFIYMDVSEFHLTEMVTFARFLEKHYGQAVQIEFSKKTHWDRGSHFHFLQARPLPAKMFEAPKVEFPIDVQTVYECLAEGVCDEALDVLDVYENNNDKKGFVVYAKSWEGSMQKKRLERGMPKEGAVMILCETEPGRGHIETLALERGVTLLYHKYEGYLEEGSAESTLAETRRNIYQCLGESSLGLGNNFAGHKKVRIVANGKIARIYPVNSP